MFCARFDPPRSPARRHRRGGLGRPVRTKSAGPPAATDTSSRRTRPPDGVWSYGQDQSADQDDLNSSPMSSRAASRSPPDPSASQLDLLRHPITVSDGVADRDHGEDGRRCGDPDHGDNDHRQRLRTPQPDGRSSRPPLRRPPPSSPSARSGSSTTECDGSGEPDARTRRCSTRTAHRRIQYPSSAASGTSAMMKNETETASRRCPGTICPVCARSIRRPRPGGRMEGRRGGVRGDRLLILPERRGCVGPRHGAGRPQHAGARASQSRSLMKCSPCGSSRAARR